VTRFQKPENLIKVSILLGKLADGVMINGLKISGCCYNNYIS